MSEELNKFFENVIKCLQMNKNSYIVDTGSNEIKVWRDPIPLKKSTFFRRKKQVYVKTVYMIYLLYYLRGLTKNIE